MLLYLFETSPGFTPRALAVTMVLVLMSRFASAAPIEAKSLLDKAGIKGGLVVHLGCGNGRLTAALRADDRYVVHGLDASSANVAAARQYLHESRLYGPVSVDRLRGNRLPYAENTVNLLIVESLGNVPMSEVMRVLVPNGVAMVKRGDDWVKSVKPWPPDIDEWTHFLHGADNNAVARDSVVGPPSSVQWAARPLWSRGHDITPSIFAMVSAKGRLFYVLQKGPMCVVDKRFPEQYSLIARDAFNGLPLWERRISPWYSSRVIWGHIPVHSERRLVADGDRVYATLGLNTGVTALDAATGETVRDYHGTENVSEIVYDQGVLALVIRKEKAATGLPARRDRKRFTRGYTGPQGGGEAIMAVDAATGDILWRQERRCMPLTLALSGGRTFFVENQNVTCLDVKTGKELWRTAFPARSLIVHSGVVVAATNRGGKGYRAPKKITVAAFSAKDGEQLWTATGDCLPNFRFFYAPVDVFAARGKVWAIAENLEWNKKPGSGALLGLDLMTGQVKQRIPLVGAFTPGHHVRCYKGKATEKYLLFNKRGIEFLNIESGGRAIQHQWVRGACRYGVLPCNGLIYAPPHSCACYPGAKLNGFHALTAHPPKETRLSAVSRLERGTAYGQVTTAEAPAPEQDEWPTYRHDILRSGSTRAVVPARLHQLWQRDVKGKLSAITAASDRIYLTSVDEHTLYCLDADTGRTQWSFIAGARIDSPPTIWRGRVLFGSRDGCCYCLRAEDGHLVWRFQAAPSERLIGAFGQLESTWPVHGAVLVRDGVVYFAAGRSSFVDGGIWVYGLDVASGKVRYQTTIAGPDPNDPTVKKTAARMPGAVPDILTSDGESLFMRHVRLRFDLSDRLGPQALSWGFKAPHHLLVSSGFLDDTFFNRTTWRYGIRIDRSQMLVVDGDDVYGLRVYWGISWNCAVFNPGDGYLLFRQNVGRPVPRPPKKSRQLGRIPFERYTWHTRVPVRVCAMVLTGAGIAEKQGTTNKRLFVAGAPDEVAPEDPLAAFEGRKGARLLALAAKDGQVVMEQKLDAVPVWDGMIAYKGRLYIALRSGQVICMGGTK